MKRHTRTAMMAIFPALAMFGTGRDTPSAPLALQPAGEPSTRFEAVDVFVDSGGSPLAAYQLEVRAIGGHETKLVGVEGGERGAFEAPPHYDPRVLHAQAGMERVVLLAYSLKDDADLPKGETRVARLHLLVQTTSPVTYQCVLAVAGDSSATEIKATSAARVMRPISDAAPAAPAPR